MTTTTPHPPALLRAWAAHSSQPLDRVSIIEPAFSQFKAGYEAQAAEMAWLELIEVNLRNRCDQLADALTGLRAKLHDVSQQRNPEYDYALDFQYQAGILASVGYLDATIAALGLQAAESAKACDK